MFPYLTYQNAHSYEKEAERLDVSKVARSARGFMRAYEKARTPENLSEHWRTKRDNFIKRHLVQYNENPTYRRYLALIMWAFKPKKYPVK